MKRSLLLLMLLVAVCGSSLAEEKRYSVPVGESPSFGPPNAPVTLIEFIDFQ